jgi:predicted NAD/FAD-dependent oxidoreductase
MAGLTAANSLKHQFSVTVFEKSRGVSGRTSTRYANDYRFDHGAQYFTAHSPAFKSVLAPLQTSGIIQNWSPARIGINGQSLEITDKSSPDHWLVPTPGMNTLAKAIAGEITIELKCQITRVEKNRMGWMLHAGDGRVFGHYQNLILAIPAAQVPALLPEGHSFHDALKNVKQTGCYTLMLGTPNAINLDFEVAEISHSPLGWVALNSAKPARPEGLTSLVVQSTNSWAEAHIDEDVPAMQALLLQELQRLTGIDHTQFEHISTHRWRYADTANALGQSHLFDEALGLGICGDWCLKGRVEAAFTSGLSLAQAVENKS